MQLLHSALVTSQMSGENGFAAIPHINNASEITHDGIYVANESRSSQLSMNPALSNYAIDYTPDDDLQATLRGLVPTVEVRTNGFQYWVADKDESFQKDGDERKRALKSGFKIVNRKSAQQWGGVVNKGLTCCIDQDELEGENPTQADKMRAIRMLKRRLLLAEISDVIALLRAASNTIEVDFSNASPAKILRNCMKDMISQCGHRPDRMNMGFEFWCQVLDYYEGRASETKGCIQTQEQLAGVLNLAQRNLISHDVVCMDADGQKNMIFGREMILSIAQEAQSMEDFSMFKRFVKRIPSGGAKAGVTVSTDGEFRVWEEQRGKLCFLTLEHYSETWQTASKDLAPKRIVVLEPETEPSGKKKAA